MTEDFEKKMSWARGTSDQTRKKNVQKTMTIKPITITNQNIKKTKWLLNVVLTKKRPAAIFLSVCRMIDIYQVQVPTICKRFEPNGTFCVTISGLKN